MSISENNYKIVFTKEARNELDLILNYISRNLLIPNSAKQLMKKIDNCLENLKFMPKLYKVIKKYPELKLEYRRLIVKSYAVIYTVDDIKKIVYIVHIYNSRINYFKKI